MIDDLPDGDGTASVSRGSRSRRPSGRLVALVVALLVVVVVAAVVWTGLRALSAKRHLDTARGDLATARQALLDRQLPLARSAITSAGSETAKAHSLTGDPVTVVLSHVPWAGRNIAVGRTLASSADDLARRVLPAALTSVDQLDPATLRGKDGTVDLALLRKAGPGLSAASSNALHVQQQVHALPHGLVAGVIDRARDSFQTQVDQLTGSLSGASDAVSVAPHLLGGDGVRRWFVLVQQTSEARGTGGIPGGYAIVQADHGKLTVLRQGSNAELTDTGDPSGTKYAPPPGVVSADFAYRYGGQVTPFYGLWQYIDQSPDLPMVARYVSYRYQAQFGLSTDGVIAVDGTALQDLLQGSGPLAIGGQQVPADGIAAYLGLGQYAANTSGDQTQRKDQLSGVAAAVLSRLTGGAGDSTALLKGVVAAVHSGHLRMATTDSALQPVLQRDRVDGALPRTAAPLTYAVVQNSEGSKLNYFLDRSVTYTADRCVTQHRRSTVTVTLTNNAPPVGTLPPYVTIHVGHPNSSDSEVLLSVYGTKGAELDTATLDGQKLTQDPTQATPANILTGTEAGLPVWDVSVDMPVGKPQTLVLHLVEPSVKGQPQVLEQPLARAEVSKMSVPTC